MVVFYCKNSIFRQALTSATCSKWRSWACGLDKCGDFALEKSEICTGDIWTGEKWDLYWRYLNWRNVRFVLELFELEKSEICIGDIWTGEMWDLYRRNVRFAQEKCEICTREIRWVKFEAGMAPTGPRILESYVNHTQLLFARQCTVIQPPCCNVNAGAPEASSMWIGVIKIVAQVVLWQQLFGYFWIRAVVKL